MILNCFRYYFLNQSYTVNTQIQLVLMGFLTDKLNIDDKAKTYEPIDLYNANSFIVLNLYL